MARNIAKHGPKVVDMTERRREAIELDRFIMERGGLRLLPRRPATWLSKPTAAALRNRLRPTTTWLHSDRPHRTRARGAEATAAGV
jgi:hypothetical protein